MNRKEKMSLCIFEEFFTPHGQKDSRPKKKKKKTTCNAASRLQPEVTQDLFRTNDLSRNACECYIENDQSWHCSFIIGQHETPYTLTMNIALVWL